MEKSIKISNDLCKEKGTFSGLKKGRRHFSDRSTGTKHHLKAICNDYRWLLSDVKKGVIAF